VAHLGTGSKRWFGLLVALGLLLFGGGLGLAQDATPSAGEDTAAGVAHPATSTPAPATPWAMLSTR